MLSSVQVDGEPANNMGSSEYCICVDQPQKITVIGTNPCSETTVISSTCEAVTITPEHGNKIVVHVCLIATNCYL